MIEEPSPATAPKLLDQVRGKIRLKHYSLRTEQTYVDWIKRHILFHGKHHPMDMGAGEVDSGKGDKFIIPPGAGAGLPGNDGFPENTHLPALRAGMSGKTAAVALHLIAPFSRNPA